MRHTLLLIAALAICVLSSACNKKKGPVPKQAPKDHGPLVPPALVAQLEQGVMKQVKANQARSCVRPVLRGSAVAGKADQAVVALFGPAAGSPVAACMASAERYKKALMAAMAAPGPAPAELTRLVKACEPLYAQVQQAVAHGDACSPYLAGRRGIDRLGPVLLMARVVVLRMRELAAGKQELAAARLGLDFARLTQDLARGEGAPVVAGIVGKAAAVVVLQAGLRPLLDRWKGRGAVKSLIAVAEELEALERTEPPFVHMLRFETTGFVLQSILPQLKGETWTPPGGFEDGVNKHPALAAKEKKAGALKTKKMRGVSEKDELALVWLASTDTIERLIAACPTTATADACARGMKAASEAIQAESAGTRFKRLFKVATSPTPRKAVRQWILAILKAVGAPAFHKYVGNYAARAFLLRAARLHALAALERTRGGKCPDLVKEDASRGLPLNDPATGKPLRVKKGKRGVFTLQPPAAPPDGVLGKYHDLSYVLTCK